MPDAPPVTTITRPFSSSCFDNANAVDAAVVVAFLFVAVILFIVVVVAVVFVVALSVLLLLVKARHNNAPVTMPVAIPSASD